MGEGTKYAAQPLSIIEARFVQASEVAKKSQTFRVCTAAI